MKRIFPVFPQKLSLTLVLVTFMALPTLGQRKLQQSRHTRIQMSGVILHKDWTKSTQSYCAHKSDYLVIRTDKGKEIVLQGHGKNVKGKKMLAFAGKKVAIDGYIKIKNIKPDPNQISQRPVSYHPITGKKSESFSCKVFVVQNIRLK
ncbi:hypothetical protein [Microscilla marina]|uniref:Uncharacterized protein n=1 Tax=Microscilla marina ATCC 23134 TaxID=313606 RepID=A1ZFF4_MICM2|nr:hypothetical protein [Microscilla marina]EAY30728.1 hypothetical protein M23134_01052 [Microscilla marina ATCC 23134]